MTNKKKRKISFKKNQKRLLIFFVFVFVFVFGSTTSAALDGASVAGGIGSAVQLIVGWIAFILVSVLGMITTLMIKMLVSVAQFSDIINVPIVVQGWVIVRDLCNMFFVLALLVIAFATILKLENYSAKRLLPKLLIMAVVINFSKMIFGLMIDASQVVMLTFVNGIGDGGHLVGLFNMDKYLSLNVNADSISSGLGPWVTVVSIIAAVFASAMTLVVVVVILAVLVMRIIFLWIYTMLSPLAFLGFAFPPIQGYTRQIWEDFVKQLIVGPILAFFLWLALTAAQSSSDALSGTEGLTTSDGQLCSGASVFFCEDDFITYILVIGLLLGGLKFAQQMGGDIAKVAGKAEAFTKKGVGKITRDPAMYAARSVGKWTGEKTRFTAAKQYFADRTTLKDGARQKRVNTQTGNIATNVGKVKENTFGKIGKGLRKGINKISGKTKDDAIQTDIKNKEAKLEQIKKGSGLGHDEMVKKVDGKIEKMSGDETETTIGSEKYVRDNEGKWRNRDGNKVADEKISKVATSQFRSEMMKKEQGSLEDDIEAQKTLQKDRTKRQNNIVSKAFKFGVMPVTAPAAGLVGKFEGAGETDVKVASKYKETTVTEAQTDNKNDSNEEVKAIMDDASIDPLKRMAATMEAANRKIIDADTLRARRASLQKQLGSKTKTVGGVEISTFKDKRLNSMFEAAASSVPGASMTFDRAERGDESAKEDIRHGYEKGHIDIKGLGVTDLKKTINELSKGMSESKFQKDYFDAGEEKQNVLKKSLGELEGNYEAKVKLALVTDVDVAFGKGEALPGSEKEKFIKSRSENWLNEMITKNPDAIKPMIDSINGRIDALSDGVMGNKSSRAQGTIKTLGIDLKEVKKEE